MGDFSANAEDSCHFLGALVYIIGLKFFIGNTPILTFDDWEDNSQGLIR